MSFVTKLNTVKGAAEAIVHLAAAGYTLYSLHQDNTNPEARARAAGWLVGGVVGAIAGATEGPYVDTKVVNGVKIPTHFNSRLNNITAGAYRGATAGMLGVMGGAKLLQLDASFGEIGSQVVAASEMVA